MAHTPTHIDVDVKVNLIPGITVAPLNGEFTCRTIKRQDGLRTTTLTMVGWTADDLEDLASLLPPPMRWAIINSLIPTIDPNQLTII